MNETKSARKARLFANLAALGFTPSEGQRLRRIESTLHRWAEAECNGEIERDDSTGKPSRVSRAYTQGNGPRVTWPVPDREGGALKSLAAICAARNDRESLKPWSLDAFTVIPYHQGDPRGCALYLVKSSDLRAPENMIERAAREWGCSWSITRRGESGKAPVYGSPQFPGLAFDTPEAIARAFLKGKTTHLPDRETLPIDAYYSRGLAVCC